MTIVITGSVAYDYLMSFPGRFKEHILPHKLESISLSFLVDDMQRQRGGVAPNIAYSLRLLGQRARIMATVGQDFGDYRAWLEAQDIDTSGIVEIPHLFTASFFVNTDQDNNQIASFYTGAMAEAKHLSFRDLNDAVDLAVISPNDPDAMTKYTRECQELDIPYLYDPSQQILRLDGEELEEGVRGARIFVANEYEYDLVKKKTGLSHKEIQKLCSTVVVTCGQKGSMVYDRGQKYEIPAVRAEPEVEPTGVGDAYRSGLIVGWRLGLPWDVTGRIAALAATYVLEQMGTQNHSYTVAEFVQRYRRVFGSDEGVGSLLTAVAQQPSVTRV